MARTIYNDHKRFLETYLNPCPGKDNMWQDTCTCLVGYGWVCLLAFCMEAGFRRAGTAPLFFLRPCTVHRPFISPGLVSQDCPSPTFPTGPHIGFVLLPPLFLHLLQTLSASVTHPEALSKPKTVGCLDVMQREAARPQAPALEQSAHSTW